VTTRADPHHFTREHLESQRGVASPQLCELVVYSLEVISQLVHAGLEFRFKGGNSQLILLPEPQRFSIDADIVTTIEKQALIDLVQGITESCNVFTACEVRQHKTKPWLPMVSFKLFFESAFPASEPPFVMLDAVLEPPPYPGIRVPVHCGDLYLSPESVEVPTISGLLADKLLCVGPGTLGIPLGKGKEAHRLKHVFDVATLSVLDVDLIQVLEALVPCMDQENALQKSEWTLTQVIADTRDFCSQPLLHAERPDPASLEPGYLEEIARGFPDFTKVLFRSSYTWPTFQDHCQRILDLLVRIEQAAG